MHSASILIVVCQVPKMQTDLGLWPARLVCHPLKQLLTNDSRQPKQ